jgi:hypothetical protein
MYFLFCLYALRGFEGNKAICNELHQGCFDASTPAWQQISVSHVGIPWSVLSCAIRGNTELLIFVAAQIASRFSAVDGDQRLRGANI